MEPRMALFTEYLGAWNKSQKRKARRYELNTNDKTKYFSKPHKKVKKMKPLIKSKHVIKPFIEISPLMVAETPLLKVPTTYNHTKEPKNHEQTTEEVTERTYFNHRGIKKFRPTKKTDGQKLFLDR